LLSFESVGHKRRSTPAKGVLEINFAFLRGHYPEQVLRVISQLGPGLTPGLSLPWLIQIF
jgi:hypothetical protein